jgi:hypothetical protein
VVVNCVGVFCGGDLCTVVCVFHCTLCLVTHIVYIFQNAVLYSCYNPLGFLERKEFLDQWSSHNCTSSVCRLCVSYVNCFYVEPKQRAVIGVMQCEMVIIDVLCCA